jgi:hypothetical protein
MLRKPKTVIRIPKKISVIVQEGKLMLEDVKKDKADESIF